MNKIMDVNNEQLQNYKDEICKFIQACDKIESFELECDISEDNRIGETYKRYKRGDKRINVRAIQFYVAKWRECTAGEALDAVKSGRKIQTGRVDDKESWYDLDEAMAYGWVWTNKRQAYRVEVN